ncbi:hypothetical protein BH10CHL1_BH10CHL1_23640 [soil metagenome]
MTQGYTSLGDFQAWELEAYADGEALPHVAAFFEANPAIKATWLHQRKLEADLNSILYRFDCPAPATLQAYYWRELPTTESKLFENHLQQCPHCTAEMVSLQAFMLETPTTMPVEPALRPGPQNALTQNLLRRAKEFADQMRLGIAYLVTPISPQFATVALRGAPIPTLQGDAQTSLLFETEETDISLLVQKEQTGRLRLAGQLFTTELPANAFCKLVPANLEDAPIQAKVDDTGNFVVNQLQPGAYQLIILLEQQSIVVPNLILE